ncbi:MAG: hypothetical protein GY953_06990, partial [bacterium]|nr:hypothetical protein [bacterium]
MLRLRYPIAAIAGNTPVSPAGPWVLPGRYTAKLTVHGEIYSQPLTIKMDPRVQTPAAELERQHGLSMKLTTLLRDDFEALTEIQAFRRDQRNASRDNEAEGVESSLTRLNGNFGTLLRAVERADVAPTSQVVAAIGAAERDLREILARWEMLKEGS